MKPGCVEIFKNKVLKNGPKKLGTMQMLSLSVFYTYFDGFYLNFMFYVCICSCAKLLLLHTYFRCKYGTCKHEIFSSKFLKKQIKFFVI